MLAYKPDWGSESHLYSTSGPQIWTSVEHVQYSLSEGAQVNATVIYLIHLSNVEGQGLDLVGR